MKHLLEKSGYAVTAAHNGCEGLEALEGLAASALPALVVSDIRMPKMDGYELCRRVKADARWREIPVILLTALSNPKDIIHGLECGADNFVVKPYESDFLLARIRTVLANRQLGPAADSGAIPIFFAGERYAISADRRQILNLLLSTYETAVQTNSDLLAAHEALKAAQAQLIEGEKLQSVGRLAAGIAHEVRNPLAILEMGLGIMDDQPLDETGRVVSQEMKEAVKRANGVITDLMELAEPEQLGARETNLHTLLESALATLGDALAHGGIEVHRHLAADLPEARVDADKITQVFINIVTNAIDAMAGGGSLGITTRLMTIDPAWLAFDAGNRGKAAFRQGERVIVIEFADTGGGLAAENVDKVFEPFFSTKPTGKGMGLGLTVARKMVEIHGGRIRLGNRDGGGACVTVTLKAA